MTVLSLKRVSVAESAGEYFRVSFSDDKKSDENYILVKRQFESPDYGQVQTSPLKRGPWT